MTFIFHFYLKKLTLEKCRTIRLREYFFMSAAWLLSAASRIWRTFSTVTFLSRFVLQNTYKKLSDDFQNKKTSTLISLSYPTRFLPAVCCWRKCRSVEQRKDKGCLQVAWWRPHNKCTAKGCRNSVLMEPFLQYSLLLCCQEVKRSGAFPQNMSS